MIPQAADVYAYGVLLYEIFTKKTVWEGLRHPQIIHAIAVMKKHPELPETTPKGFKVPPPPSRYGPKSARTHTSMEALKRVG